MWFYCMNFDSDVMVIFSGLVRSELIRTKRDARIVKRGWRTKMRGGGLKNVVEREKWIKRRLEEREIRENRWKEGSGKWPVLVLLLPHHKGIGSKAHKCMKRFGLFYHVASFLAAISHVVIVSGNCYSWTSNLENKWLRNHLRSA